MTQGNLNAVDELLADDYVHYTLPPGMEPDREGFKAFVAAATPGRCAKSARQKGETK